MHQEEERTIGPIFEAKGKEKESWIKELGHIKWAQNHTKAAQPRWKEREKKMGEIRIWDPTSADQIMRGAAEIRYCSLQVGLKKSGRRHFFSNFLGFGWISIDFKNWGSRVEFSLNYWLLERY